MGGCRMAAPPYFLRVLNISGGIELATHGFKCLSGLQSEQ